MRGLLKNKELLVICLRYVNNELEINEDFVGFYQISMLIPSSCDKGYPNEV